MIHKKVTTSTPLCQLGLICLLLLCLCLYGCTNRLEAKSGSYSDTSNETLSDGTIQTDLLPNSYLFYCGETQKSTFLYPGMEVDADKLAQLVGEPLSEYEAPSCALAGTDHIYTYSGYEITTYRESDAKSGENSTETLFSIRLTDDSYTTAEGIYIGQTVPDLLAAYGETESVSGEYCYQQGKMELSFLTRNQTIISIEYRLL